MFGFLENLASAAVKVAVSPVAVAADIVSMPFTADGTHDHPMQKTADLLESSGRDYSRALK